MSRLTAERLEELYLGTLKLVAEHGYDRLTMDQIAEATKSSKATLYRQWGSKSALVVEALKCLDDHEDELPDTGTLRGDLMLLIEPGANDDPGVLTAIMHAVRKDDELAEAVRTQILEPERERIGAVVQRAVDRGEIARDCPALPFVDYILFAPIVLHHVIEGEELAPEFLRRYLDGALLPALGIH